MPYNWERNGGTMRSFREMLKHNEVHCLEAAISAAVILEQHGYPPLLLDLESEDLLDHVIFVYQENGLWGSVARSRAARPQAGLSLVARSGVELFRSVCRFYRQVEGLRPRESLRPGRLRLA